MVENPETILNGFKNLHRNTFEVQTEIPSYFNNSQSNNPFEVNEDISGSESEEEE